MPNESNEYEVGYGKPPKKHQFKPGYSGNKKGRPKGSLNVFTEIEKMRKKSQNYRQRKNKECFHNGSSP